MPTISVLMPARNCEAYVAEAIDSIINQTFLDWELVVCDDDSTDGTRSIVDQYEDSRIRRIHNDTRLGVASTRNRLLQAAYGDLITWLDADDISHRRRLEILVESFNKKPELHLCGSNGIRRYKWSGDTLVTNYPVAHEDIRYTIESSAVVPFIGASVAFRKHVLNRVAGFRTFFNIGAGDPDFILRVSEKYYVGNVPDVLYEFRYTRNSVSRSYIGTSYLRLYLQEILFFLAEQRAHNAGLDGLMEGGDKEGFERFLDSLRLKFERDRSKIYRVACLSKLSNQDYVYAMLDAIHAIISNPLEPDNYMLPPKVGGSLTKTLFRATKRRLIPPPRVSSDN